MDIYVSHIKCKNIPLFVFPCGVRPSRPAKVAGEGRFPKSKARDSLQADKSCESTTGAADAADDRRKRKLDDDNNSRNAKYLTSITSANGDVVEGSRSRSPSIIIPSATTTSSSITGGSMDADAPEEARQREQLEHNVRGTSTNTTCLTQTHSGEVEESVRCSPPVKPFSIAANSSCSKEAEKLAIEKITSGPSVGCQDFPVEFDELEDEFGSKDQEKISGRGMEGSPVESSNAKVGPVAGNMVIPNTGVLQNGGLEELEVFCAELVSFCMHTEL